MCVVIGQGEDEVTQRSVLVENDGVWHVPGPLGHSVFHLLSVPFSHPQRYRVVLPARDLNWVGWEVMEWKAKAG